MGQAETDWNGEYWLENASSGLKQADNNNDDGKTIK